MKNIYNASNKEVAAAELDNLDEKWGGKYPYAILSWRNNWDDLTVFFQFPLEIRKIITQNQSFHSLRTMLLKRLSIFHLWKLKRNGHSLFITGN